MEEIKKAVRGGGMQCIFFDELARVARGWAGDINGTQAYVLEEYLLIMLKILSHQPEGEKEPCALAVYANEAWGRGRDQIIFLWSGQGDGQFWRDSSG